MTLITVDSPDSPKFARRLAAASLSFTALIGIVGGLLAVAA